MDVIGAVRRRWDGDFTVDPWGLDAELVSLLAPVTALRWRVDVEGGDRLPEHGPALVVVSRWWGLSEPFVVARAVWSATGRPARLVGLPDVAPIGPALRRLGGVVARPDEVAGLLRAGELVVVPLARGRRPGRAGVVDPELIVPALDLDVPVIPVAVRGRELGRRWRVRVGSPVDPIGALPATRATGAVQTLLDRR